MVVDPNPDNKDLDPETREYIAQLQDRMQWLEQEREKSERENLRQHQEGTPDGPLTRQEIIEDYEKITQELQEIAQAIEQRKKKREMIENEVKGIRKRLEDILGTKEEMNEEIRELEDLIEFYENTDPLYEPGKENTDSS